MRLWDDVGLQQIGWLAGLLIALALGEVLLGLFSSQATVEEYSFFTVLLWASMQVPALLGPLAVRSVYLPACAAVFLLLALSRVVGLAGLGAALAPVAVGLLVVLLPRPDTAPAAAQWGLAVAAVLWTVVGALGLIGLTTLPTPLGSAAIPVLGALIAYNAGLRAGLRQGLSERVATGIGMTLAVAGAIALWPTGLANFALVGGLALGLLAVQVAPAPPASAPPVVRQTTLTALLAAHGQIVFVAPLTFALLWLVRTVAP